MCHHAPDLLHLRDLPPLRDKLTVDRVGLHRRVWTDDLLLGHVWSLLRLHQKKLLPDAVDDDEFLNAGVLSTAHWKDRPLYHCRRKECQAPLTRHDHVPPQSRKGDL